MTGRWFAVVPFAAFLLDTLLGDPRSRWHPVVLIGNVITFAERHLYPQTGRPADLLRRGVLLVLFVLITVGAVGAMLLYVAARLHYGLYLAASALMLYITITPRALARDGLSIRRRLAAGDLAAARRELSWIVGRDTEELSESEIARATIETVAENIVDGIISPLFYFALFGPLGALLYRASNTMDSMVGYKNDRYLYFGRAAALWDDAVNFLPARLTAGLLLIAAAVLRLDVRHARRMLARDAAKHPSPNGGYAEATVAGALHIRLGGYNSYRGRVEFREYMGEPLVKIGGEHITRTVQLMYVTTVLGVLAVTICEMIW